jgi:hypothetical protein
MIMHREPVTKNIMRKKNVNSNVDNYRGLWHQGCMISINPPQVDMDMIMKIIVIMVTIIMTIVIHPILLRDTVIRIHRTRRIAITTITVFAITLMIITITTTVRIVMDHTDHPIIHRHTPVGIRIIIMTMIIMVDHITIHMVDTAADMVDTAADMVDTAVDMVTMVAHAIIVTDTDRTAINGLCQVRHTEVVATTQLRTVPDIMIMIDTEDTADMVDPIVAIR